MFVNIKSLLPNTFKKFKIDNEISATLLLNSFKSDISKFVSNRNSISDLSAVQYNKNKVVIKCKSPALANELSSNKSLILDTLRENHPDILISDLFIRS